MYSLDSGYCFDSHRHGSHHPTACKTYFPVFYNFLWSFRACLQPYTPTYHFSFRSKSRSLISATGDTLRHDNVLVWGGNIEPMTWVCGKLLLSYAAPLSTYITCPPSNTPGSRLTLHHHHTSFRSILHFFNTQHLTQKPSYLASFDYRSHLLTFLRSY